jgi:hypothetical protein
LFGKPEGKRLLGRPMRRRENNIKMDIKVIGWENMDWVYLAQDREHWQVLLYAVMNLWISSRQEIS